VPEVAVDDARVRPVWTPTRDRRVLEWAVPVPDPEQTGTRIGELVAHFDWAQVSKLAGHVQAGLAASDLDVDFLVVDDRGRVLGGAWKTVASPLGSTVAGLSWTTVGALLGTPGGGFGLERAIDAVVGAVPAPGLGAGWRIVALQPRAQALAPVYRMRRQIVLLLLVVVGVALAFGAWLAQRLGHPLRELTAATRQLAATGELARPIPVRSADEVGELAHAFNVAAEDLRRARDDVVTASKLAFVGELAAGMAHEVRTPLGILRSSAQMLGRDPSVTGPRRDELVTMIVEEVDRLDRVVTGLTDLARPRELMLQATRLTDVLGRVADFVEHQARERAVEIRRELAPDGDPAWCDPDEMHQVALNLVMNAVQMMPRGGRLTIRSLPRRNGVVGFEVEDTGPGLSAERQRRIFTPFVSFREGGTGLGLALAQRTVVSHGGTISVQSVEGRGAVFRVEVPAAEGLA
jgi:two-component system sensor histidine kinase HydH